MAGDRGAVPKGILENGPVSRHLGRSCGSRKGHRIPQSKSRFFSPVLSAAAPLVPVRQYRLKFSGEKNRQETLKIPGGLSRGCDCSERSLSGFGLVKGAPGSFSQTKKYDDDSGKTIRPPSGLIPGPVDAQ